MSDLPELKNEPTVDIPSGDLEGFSREFRISPGERHHQANEPPKSPIRYFPALLAILVAVIGGWHLIAVSRLEERFNRIIENTAGEHSKEFSASVNVNPLTNLVDLQITLKSKRDSISDALLEVVIQEFVRENIEPVVERELSAAARRGNDLYAMMVPYQVSISIDHVRAPSTLPPSRMVQEVQRELSARGYDPGMPEGRLGARTRNAIEQFQRDHGLAVDGRATGELLELLREK